MDEHMIDRMAAAAWAKNCEQCRKLGVVMIPWQWQEEPLKAAWREMMVAAVGVQNAAETREIIKRRMSERGGAWMSA